MRNLARPGLDLDLVKLHALSHTTEDRVLANHRRLLSSFIRINGERREPPGWACITTCANKLPQDNVGKNKAARNTAQGGRRRGSARERVRARGRGPETAKTERRG